MYPQLDGDKFEQALRVGDGSEAWCAAVHEVATDRRQLSDWAELNWIDVLDFPGATVVKNLPASPRDARDMGSIPVLGRSPERSHGNSLQYSCLENAIERGSWQSTVHGIAKNLTWLKQLSTHIDQPYHHLGCGLTLDLQPPELWKNKLLLFWAA